MIICKFCSDLKLLHNFYVDFLLPFKVQMHQSLETVTSCFFFPLVTVLDGARYVRRWTSSKCLWTNWSTSLYAEVRTGTKNRRITSIYTGSSQLKYKKQLSEYILFIGWTMRKIFVWVSGASLINYCRLKKLLYTRNSTILAFHIVDFVVLKLKLLFGLKVHSQKYRSPLRQQMQLSWIENKHLTYTNTFNRFIEIKCKIHITLQYKMINSGLNFLP